MGATVPTFANMSFWPYLQMIQTNYGGDLQVSTIEPYDGYDIGYLLNQAATDSVAGRNLPIPVATNSVAGGNLPIPIATDSVAGGSYGDYNTIPPEITRGAKSMADFGLNSMTKQNFTTHLNSLSLMKIRLNSTFQDPNKTEDQRNEIEKMIKKLDEQFDKLKEIMESENLDAGAKYRAERDLEIQSRTMIRDMLKELQNMQPDNSNNANNANNNNNANNENNENNVNNDNVNNNNNNSNNANNENNVNNENNSNNDNVNNDNENNNNVNETVDRDVKRAADQIYDAMYGLGTDDDKFEEVLNWIDEDTVMPLMIAWNKYHSAEQGESLMEAFMDDADSGFCWAGGQKKKYGKIIARALREKAEALGVYDELKEDFGKIDKELGSIFYISNDIAKVYDKIIKVLAEKMGSKYGSPITAAPEKTEKKDSK